MHTFKTKFEPGDKVKLSNGNIGKIIQIHIFYPSGEDMDHWKKTLPKLPNGKYQYTSYTVEIDGDEFENPEHALTLVS